MPNFGLYEEECSACGRNCGQCGNSGMPKETTKPTHYTLIENASGVYGGRASIRVYGGDVLLSAFMASYDECMMAREQKPMMIYGFMLDYKNPAECN